jgi:beta-glucosidase
MIASSADILKERQGAERRAQALLAEMTLAEKVGQMSQAEATHGHPPDYLAERLRAGGIGSVINNVDVGIINDLQRIAVEESRLGIPLLVGRDVIHGFRTAMPIPLGQGATWNPEIVREGARVAALEAARCGVNWTFAPMIDISRDPRWGRVAEGFGECVLLTSTLGAAMVEGFQGDSLSDAGSIAACAKHFAGYGAVESGRDYATTNIPDTKLRNVYFRPFEAAVEAGVSTVMTSFSDLNGVPATGNHYILSDVLRGEWGFDGFVVSDWDSIRQLRIHGLTEDDRGSAYEAVAAGVDMEMAGDAFSTHLLSLVEQGEVSERRIDDAVLRILRIKFELGLFEDPYTDPVTLPAYANKRAIDAAYRAALQSVVLLKNESAVLPLRAPELSSLAIIGPLADAPYEQLGTWMFDGDESLSVTPLQAIRDAFGSKVEVRYVQAMENSRSRASDEFDIAASAAADCDATLLFLGEEAILSGEAHSRADIGLPGDQVELVRRVRAAGKRVIAVIMAGRPLTLSDIVDEVDAILYAWHPGTMGGPAIADLLFGVESPSGKLPATFPRVVGQIPIYYSQKNGGKPPTPETVVHIDDIDPFAPQTSLGMSAFHLDTCFTPLFPFGFGLSYTQFDYSNISVSAAELPLGGRVTISATLSNRGDVEAEEVVQLYTRDLVASITRPVKELKGFTRMRLKPGETRTVSFELGTDDLSFSGRDGRRVVEPGLFHAWIGGCSDAAQRTEFRIVNADDRG